jgi:hypothetical protein
MDERARIDPESLSERGSERGEEDEESIAIDEAAVAAFGQWYESQPADWIEHMDALGRKPPVASRP